MLNIVLINAVYPPEPVVSAQMGQDLARHLSEYGAHITVLCPFPTRPLGVQYHEYSASTRKEVTVERVHGVNVIRVPSLTASASRLVNRMIESISFGQQVCRYLEENFANIDVVYANVWPLFSQALIARHCARRGVLVIFHVKDMYPESLRFKLPYVGRNIVLSALKALDKWIVRQAALVVVLSENMRRAYMQDRGLMSNKVITIRDWMDESRFVSLPSRGEACRRYKVAENVFTFLYLGNIGPVAGVEELIEGFHAARLKHAQLLIVGDGSAKAACEALAKRLEVTDVRFISDPDVENVPLLQSLGHVCLLPLRKGAGSSSVPSKLISYLFSAKPVLATVDAESDTARCIQESQCGWVGEPGNMEWLSSKMTEVAAMSPEVLRCMGADGKKYGLKIFSKHEGVQHLANIILEMKRKPS